MLCRWHKLQGYSFRWHHDHYNIHVMPGWELILTFMLLICALSIGRRILMGQGLVKQRWDRGWARLQMLQQHWKNVPGGGQGWRVSNKLRIFFPGSVLLELGVTCSSTKHPPGASTSHTSAWRTSLSMTSSSSQMTLKMLSMWWSVHQVEMDKWYQYVEEHLIQEWRQILCQTMTC